MTTTSALQNDENRMKKSEGMPHDCDVACSSFWLRASFVIRHLSFVICCSVILMIVVEMWCGAPAQAQSPNMIGRWNVEINFADGNKRSLRFDAQDGGKGTFLLLDPTLKVWGPAKPSEAKWTPGDQNSVTFSGAVEFPIGNVGRDPRGSDQRVDLRGRVRLSGRDARQRPALPLRRDPGPDALHRRPRP